jgi:hypothetical protein
MRANSNRICYPDERHYKDGAVMIWPRQLALLQGLLDRPDGRVTSRHDAVCAAWPHVGKLTNGSESYALLCKTLPRLVRRGWVAKYRVGRKNHFALTARGRAIAWGAVLARIYGGAEWRPRSAQAHIGS